MESVTGSVRSSGTGLLCAGCMAACVQAQIKVQRVVFVPTKPQQAAICYLGASKTFSFSSLAYFRLPKEGHR